VMTEPAGRYDRADDRVRSGEARRRRVRWGANASDQSRGNDAGRRRLAASVTTTF